MLLVGFWWVASGGLPVVFWWASGGLLLGLVGFWWASGGSGELPVGFWRASGGFLVGFWWASGVRVCGACGGQLSGRPGNWSFCSFMSLRRCGF